MSDREPIFIEGISKAYAELALQPGDVKDGMYSPDILDERLTELLEEALDDESFVDSIRKKP